VAFQNDLMDCRVHGFLPVGAKLIRRSNSLPLGGSGLR
jgi:hypothetical protein